MASLQRRKLPHRLQTLVNSAMFSGYYQLVVNGSLSPPAFRNRGLPQGSPLSPVIFNMFIDSLVVQLNSVPGKVPQTLFYADDGVLLAPDDRSARKLTLIAERWAQTHGMVYNVAKCGIISLAPLASDIQLQGHSIPQVSSYKYLGFPVTSRGIDFRKHIQTLAETTQNFLRFIRHDSREWTPSTRWIIYRTFIRPKLEYGAPLVQAFLKHSIDNSLIKYLENIQRDAMTWIFNVESTHHNIHAGILGVLPIPIRYSHLRTRFQLHLEFSSPFNPLRSLMDNSTPFQLINDFHQDALFKDFRRTNPFTRDHSRQSTLLSNFLLSNRAQFIETNAKALLRYITPDARTPSYVDGVVKAPPEWQSMFFSWRRGSLFLKHICVCKRRWVRGCITCLPKISLSSKLSQQFQQRKLKINALFPNRESTFCELDFLLNIHEWKLAADIIESWKKLLIRSDDDGIVLVAP